MGRFLSTNNDLDVEKALTAMILTETLEEAVELLKPQNVTTTPDTLKVWRDRMYKDRYEERRSQLAAKREEVLTNDLLDVKVKATIALKLAIDQSTFMLNNGLCVEPWRVARDLSQVMAQATDKRLALQGRPTQIIEKRDPDETLRKLQSMGVVQVIEGTVVEDD